MNIMMMMMMMMTVLRKIHASLSGYLLRLC